MKKIFFLMLLSFACTGEPYAQSIERNWDLLGRVTEERYSDSTFIIYTYDNMGNLLGRSVHAPY